MRREQGRVARSIDFSWTWNENKKKMREEFTYEQKIIVQINQTIRLLSSLTSANINLWGVGFRSRFHDEGIKAVRVETIVNLTSVGRDSSCFSFTRTEREHQMLATLSSYSPRLKGNRRCKTCRVRAQLPRNGDQHTTNVPITANPRYTTLLNHFPFG